ncbi:MAG TPA: hypothetical protein VFJ06_08300 [Halococcus sp.]|nr:hypothetical protein [Halococcus sp.]
MTGLSPEVASFQAASAFSGAGYTTEEAEQTVTTPERRKIIKTLIRLGSLSLLGALIPLIGSFAGGNGTNHVPPDRPPTDEYEARHQDAGERLRNHACAD